MMPVHGKYAGMEKPPKGEGVGTGDPVQAKEDSEGGGGGAGRGPRMTPEEARERAESQRKWDEMNAGPLGKLMWLGSSPNSKATDPKHTGAALDKWREFAKSVGPAGVKKIIDALEPEFHGAVETAFGDVRREQEAKKAEGRWHPDFDRELDADAEEWEKNQVRVRAAEYTGYGRGGKGHEKQVPGSHYAHQLVNEMMRADNNRGRSPIDTLHRLNAILASATATA
jgi:hypothetical protein